VVLCVCCFSRSRIHTINKVKKMKEHPRTGRRALSWAKLLALWLSGVLVGLGYSEQLRITFLPGEFKPEESSSSNQAEEDDHLTVEDVMYTYGSDKSKDDHKYSDFYEMTFGPLRKDIRNMTEIGIAAGQSVQAWYRYFPKAHIHGFDIKIDQKVRENLEKLGSSRVTLDATTNILSPDFNLQDIGFAEGSMDIIIEDGPHTLESQEIFLHKMFPAVKPGGYYVIEDIDYKLGGGWLNSTEIQASSCQRRELFWRAMTSSWSRLGLGPMETPCWGFMGKRPRIPQ
jgi:hypothetical protein